MRALRSTTPRKKAPVPVGRPPSSRAGEVDRRILDAASELFLALGFEGTSCDEVAVRARAGKASIYARYANKEELFAAVLRRDADRHHARLPAPSTDTPFAERLLRAVLALVEESLRGAALAMLRLRIAEAARFPDLAASSRDQGIARDARRLAEVIAGDGASPEHVARAVEPATRLVELALVPLQMRALLGEDLDALRRRAPRAVEAAIAVLTSAGILGA